MNEKIGKKEHEARLPVIITNPQHTIVSNGALSLEISGELARGLFNLFANRCNKMIPRDTVRAAASRYGSHAKSPDESGIHSLKQTLERIDRAGCIENFYGNTYRLRARLEVDENLRPTPIPRKPRN